MAGDNPNRPRSELWESTLKRSLDQPDAWKRIDDLVAIIQEDEAGTGRHLIYPAKDPRVLRVARKVIRGLASYHKHFQFVPDDIVWVDVLRFRFPDRFLSTMSYHHRESDIAEYWYTVFNQEDIHSAWLVRFFESATFFGVIYGPKGIPEAEKAS